MAPVFRVAVPNRPDSAVRMLTALASFAYFAGCAGAILILIGAPMLKLWAPADQTWEWGLPIPVSVTNAEATVATSWGPTRLEVDDARASLRLPIALVPWWLFALLWIHTALAAGLSLTFLRHLRHVLLKARDGAPFDAENGPRLWWMGLTLIWLYAVNGVANAAVSQSVDWALTGDEVVVRRGLPADPRLIIAALVLLALAVVFRRGSELEDEQSLVV